MSGGSELTASRLSADRSEAGDGSQWPRRRFVKRSSRDGWSRCLDWFKQHGLS